MSEVTDNLLPVRVGIEGVFYSLAHVPELVRYGSKPLRSIAANPVLGQALKRRLRDFDSAVAYLPHQVYIGNFAPERLTEFPRPWYDKWIDGAEPRGRFGDLVDQNKFYAALAKADQFDLVSFEESWLPADGARRGTGRAAKPRSAAEIQALCDKGALPLYSGERLVGAFESAHAADHSLAAEVLLENLAAKVTAAHSLRSVCRAQNLEPGEIDFVISCSEEAVG